MTRLETTERVRENSVRRVAASPASSRWLFRFSWFVLGFMVLVILEGAVVRGTGSGAGCGNHWPLCNGQVIPHHPRLATIIEFAHRSLTGLLSGMVALLVLWTFRQRPPSDPARRAAVAVVVFLITEALLGAVLVKGGYVEFNASNARVVVQCIHFTNTMLLVAALTLTAWTLRPSSARRLERAPSSTSRLAWTAVAATILTGATGSVAALADTLFPAPSLRAGLLQDFAAKAPLLVRMRWVHPAAAVVMTLCAAQLCFRLRERSTAVLAGWLLALQLALGIGDVLLLAPLWLQILHLLGADLFWIALVVLAAGSVRPSEGSAPLKV